MPRITAIPATKKIHTSPTALPSLRRVAGYARVSTDNDDQVNSYEAQVDYYEHYIKNHDSWQYVDIYTDEGISGTSTKHRDGFNRMIADALAGKIDLIVTKSVSRFARNTVDSLTTVRKLKDKGVEVFFEKENIWTLDSKGELLITIMSSLAQEESRSISENVTWGHRKRFQDGKPLIPYSSMIGLTKNEDGTIGIDPDGAAIVRRIYHDFLTGHSIPAIAAQLTREHILTPRGHEKWSPSTVKSILSNEKYKGDALLQKTFTVDYLTKEKKTNEGEVPQYYVTGSHPAIIDPETWQLAQLELERTSKLGRRNQTFSAIVICAHCGNYYGPKLWHSTDKYRIVIWQCNKKYALAHPKQMPNFTNQQLQEAYQQALAILIKRRHLIDTSLVAATLTDASHLEETLAEQAAELDIATGLLDQAVTRNTRTLQNQDEYATSFAKLEARRQQAQQAWEATRDEIRHRHALAAELASYKRTLSRMKKKEPFNPVTMHALTKSINISPNGTITVTFKDGTTINPSA